MSDISMRVLVSGRVQGVGFRAATRREALVLGLAGSAANLPDGRVEVHAEGTRPACDSLLAWLRGDSTPGAVSAVEVSWDEPSGATGFLTR